MATFFYYVCTWLGGEKDLKVALWMREGGIVRSLHRQREFKRIEHEFAALPLSWEPVSS